jgi:hypothetical protein
MPIDSAATPIHGAAMPIDSAAMPIHGAAMPSRSGAHSAPCGLPGRGSR